VPYDCPHGLERILGQRDPSILLVSDAAQSRLSVVSKKAEIFGPGGAAPFVKAIHGGLENIRDLGSGGIVIDVGEVAV
jgi:hypothetical protein